ncbi:GMC family oxidoreductase [Roseibium sp.]|uniref:GMC family oxidoreductase n=1 Tax=Roseibium sp. TaxID=1936156 RepID=UPI003D09E5EA
MPRIVDYLVIGAGTAGSVVAGRLSEQNPGTICVLEAGPRDRHPSIHVPAAVVHALGNPKINWMYPTLPHWGTAGRELIQSRGKTLGGSGSINGHIYTRGHRSDFDNWAAKGNPGWSYAEVLPYFRRSETCIGIGSDFYRGRKGPFTITAMDEPDPLAEAFMDAAETLGIPRNPDYNGEKQDGISYVQRSIHRGRRVSPARAFLYPAMRRGNTEVLTDALVTRLLFEGRRAVGAVFVRHGVEHEVRARKEVILCAGTIATPQLLQVSGVGSPDLLSKIGVHAVHALAGVGENLSDHYAARIVLKIRGARTINERTRGLPLVAELLRYAAVRRGALTLSPTLVYCFWKSQPWQPFGDIQVSFTPASYPSGIWSGLDRFPGATMACWQQRPKSRGHVRALSADVGVKPEFFPNYLGEEEDRRAIVSAMRLARRIARQPAFERFVEEEHWPGPNVEDDVALLAHARETGNTTYHPIGTCRMGPADHPASVVDAELRVHGIEALRVADCSVIPEMLAANTNAAALLIGEKAADLVLGRPALPAAELLPAD